MKQLTRQQLQNDLAAARKHQALLEEESNRYREDANRAWASVKQLTEERDDWRFAFRTVCKLAAK